jgi:dipeptidyl aminopeptidase/acylaminoacyl peptidase
MKKAKPLLPLKWKKYENIETRGRALSLSRDGRYLAFSAEKDQRDLLYLFDLQTDQLKRIPIPFDQIRSPVFSPVDDNLVCVGMKRGFNDIYLIDQKGNVVERLTDNEQDEKDPVFSLNGERVYYSGEVLPEKKEDEIQRDIFSVDLKSKTIERVTSLKGRETEPEVLPDGTLVFVRDRSDDGKVGYNLYQTGKGFLTDLIGGGFSPRYAPAYKSLFFVGFENGEKQIYQGTWTYTVASAPETPTDINGKYADAPANGVWRRDGNEPLLKTEAKPYRFKSSTDIFIPFFLYSTQDGLVVVDVWQYSELLGNHTGQVHIDM